MQVSIPSQSAQRNRPSGPSAKYPRLDDRPTQRHSTAATRRFAARPCHSARRTPARLHRSLSAVLGAWILWAAACGAIATAEQTPQGYADYAALRRQMQQLAASPLAQLQSLGRTCGGREVLLLRVGSDKLDAKPAVLIVGGVDPPQLLGSHLALDIARRLVLDGRSDPETARLLKQVTFYVIPRACPDASEAFFQTPAVERSVNLRPMDDDDDGRVDEDGPEDLNGDGLITAMRVEDPAGPMMAHPDDSRVLIEADPKKNETGRWRLLVEGRDNDQDGELNEDPPGGVAFDRNFTFRYPYFESGSVSGGMTIWCVPGSPTLGPKSRPSRRTSCLPTPDTATMWRKGIGNCWALKKAKRRPIRPMQAGLSPTGPISISGDGRSPLPDGGFPARTRLRPMRPLTNRPERSKAAGPMRTRTPYDLPARGLLWRRTKSRTAPTRRQARRTNGRRKTHAAATSWRLFAGSSNMGSTDSWPGGRSSTRIFPTAGWISADSNHS